MQIILGKHKNKALWETKPNAPEHSARITNTWRNYSNCKPSMYSCCTFFFTILFCCFFIHSVWFLLVSSGAHCNNARKQVCFWSFTACGSSSIAFLLNLFLWQCKNISFHWEINKVACPWSKQVHGEYLKHFRR